MTAPVRQRLKTILRRIVLVMSWLGFVAIEAAGAGPVLPTPEPSRVLMAPGNLLPSSRRCLIHGAPLYESQDLKSPVLGSLQYLEKVELAEGYPEKAGERYWFDLEKRAQHDDWALVCEADPAVPNRIKSFRGWIPRKYLTDRLEAERFPETLVQKKCVVVFKGSGGGRQVESVRPVLAPATVKTHLQGLSPIAAPPPLELYRLLFVYAEYGDWVLVSPDPAQIASTTPDAQLQEAVFGWIPKERIAMWTTRECLQWDRESYPSRLGETGRLFLSPEEAIAWSSQEDAKSSKDGRAIQEPDPRSNGKVMPLAKDAMRFHLLLDPQNAQEKGLANAPSWTRHSKGTSNSLYELGAVLSDGRINSRIEGEQSKLESLASEAADTEILFVIDDTGSMRIAFRVVSRIVQQIAESIVKLQGTGDVRVGICYYHDGDTIEQAVDTETTALESIRDKFKLGRRIAELENKKADGKGGSDPLERVYDGISRGITAARFKDHSRKLVFLIGDCGDNGNSTATLEDIAEQLVPAESSPIEFHVIQIKNPDKRDEYKVLRTQLQERLQKLYISRLNERFAEQFEAENEVPKTSVLISYRFIDTPAQGEPNLDEIVAAVSRNVLPSITNAQKEGDVLRKSLRSFITTAKLDVEDVVDVGIPSKVLLQQILKDSGLEEYGKSAQLYRTLYAWEFNSQNQRQLKRMLFVKNTEISTAISALRALEQNLREGRDLKSLDAVITVLAKQVGSSEDIPPSITDDLGKAKWLIDRLSFKSDVFVKLLDPETNGKPELNDYQKVFLKRRLLESILEGRQTSADDYIEVPLPGSLLKEWQLRNEITSYRILQRGFSRFYKSGTSTEQDLWYYVDYNEEWP